MMHGAAKTKKIVTISSERPYSIVRAAAGSAVGWLGSCCGLTTVFSVESQVLADTAGCACISTSLPIVLGVSHPL